MKPPVFVVEGSDVSMFQDAQTAQGWLEAPDVRAGIYEIFDADGTHLKATAESDDSPVVILDQQTGAPEAERLRMILRNHISAVRSAKPDLVELSDVDLSKAELPELIIEIQGIDERHRSGSIGAKLARWASKLRGSPQGS